MLIGIGTPLLGKASFSGADLIAVREPWKSLEPTGFTPHVPSVSDTVDSVFPNRHYFAQELHHGEVATWNPLGSGGSPLGGIVTFGFFTPINLPYLLLPTWLAPGLAEAARAAGRRSGSPTCSCGGCGCPRRPGWSAA